VALTLITAPTSYPVTLAEAKRQVLLGSSAGEPAPTAPTVALATPAAPGNCDNGAWRIGVTFVTADGETELGPLSAAVTVADKTVNGQLAVTNISLGGSAVTARNVYALAPGETVAKYVGQIANNTATTLTVNIAASSLGVQAPTVNTTVDPEVTRRIAAATDRAELATGRQLITATYDQVLDRFPDAHTIELPKPPLQSVTSVTYRDSTGTLQTLDASRYVVTNAVAVPPVLNPRQPRGRIDLAPGEVWPATYGQAGDVVIRFVCGYGAASAVPSLLKDAILMDLATRYAQRENVITGASVTDSDWSGRIYRSFRSYPTQRRAA